MGGCVRLAAYLSTLLLAPAGALAQQQVIGAPPEASNMRLVGYSDLQARSVTSSSVPVAM